VVINVTMGHKQSLILKEFISMEGPEVLSASGKGLHPYHQRDTSNEDED